MEGDRRRDLLPPDHPSGCAAPAPPLAVAAALLRRWPHLPAFFPDHACLPEAAAPGGAAVLVLDGAPPPRRHTGGILATEAPWQAPRFGPRHAPVALLAAPATAAEAAADPAALAQVLRRAAARGKAPPGCDLAPRALMDLLREARVGGPAGLPDPGPAGLGLPRGEAVLVLDPCRGDRAAAARAMLAAAIAGAADRPVLVAASPAAPPGAAPVLNPAAQGARALAGRLAPWTLLDLAQALHGLGDPLEVLAPAAGVAVTSHAAAPWAGLDPEALFAALAAATRCADPFRARPWTLRQAIRQLADWRVREAENRRILACTGIEWFKLGQIRAALASGAGAPAIRARGSRAIAIAKRDGGAVAVWAAAMPPGLPARCAAAGVPLVRVEDGFIRSAGLGVQLAPAASLVLDGQGIHYDPATESGIERLIARAAFDAALLDRARSLREALIAQGVTKYNLGGGIPDLGLPPGRRVILVPGQVEDDAAVRQGAGRIRTNLDLLRAVRRENPDAVLLYKPHPDVETGLRTGAVPAQEAALLADRVLSRVPIGGLYALVAAVHTIGSLAGFEALLRGLPVTAWGRPFYAGWGLTEDRDPLPPRPAAPDMRHRRWDAARAAPLALDALVAAALILYPRYLDPVTGLPCGPDLLLERLAAPPAARRQGVPVPLGLRAFTARTSRRLAAWWAGR